MLLLGLWLGVAGAGDRWFLASGGVDVGDGIGVPLVRSADDPRPQVLVEAGDSALLAVVDLVGGWSRVSWDTVGQLGLNTRVADDGRTFRVRATIPELRVGGAALTDLRVEVGGDDPMVLGLGALGIGAAILPSEGVVRLTRQGHEAVVETGAPAPAPAQRLGPWWQDGEKRWGNGVSRRVSAVVQVGSPDARATEGAVHLRTDLRRTALAPAVLPDGAWHAGTPTATARVRLGEIALPFVTARADGSLGDPDPAWIGAVGADALYAVDLAVDPVAAEMSWQSVASPTWADGRAFALAAARVEAASSGPLPSGPLPWEGGEGTSVSGGDPGRLFARRTAERLATAAWAAGEIDEALPASASAALAGADHCLPWLVLGTRRLRAGADDPLSPIAHANGLWRAWASLSPEARDRYRGGAVSDTDLSVPQEADCAQGVGREALARLALGADPTSVADGVPIGADPRDPWAPLAAGIARLRAGAPRDAEGPLRIALERGGGAETWLALAVALAGQGRTDEARALIGRVDWEDPHPLTTAWVAWRIGLLSDPDDPGADAYLAREVVRVAAGGSIPPKLRGRLTEAADRTAEAPWTIAARLVIDRVEGRPTSDAELARWRARNPDAWAPMLLDPDRSVQERAWAALRARFPELALPDLPEMPPEGATSEEVVVPESP